MNACGRHSVLCRHMEPNNLLLSVPGAGVQELESGRQGNYLPRHFRSFCLSSLHLPFWFYSLPCLTTPCSPALPHCFLFLIQGCMMLFPSQCIIHFLAGNAVLRRINIWVLFTGLQSARIAWGIQFHKLFLMGNQ